MFWVLLLICLPKVQTSCDLCDCTFPIATCSGQAITEFVYFGADESQIQLLIYDFTLITELPLLNDTFQQLQALNLFNNFYLPCTEIVQFSYSHPDIKLLTDRSCVQGTSDAAGSTTEVSTGSSRDVTTAASTSAVRSTDAVWTTAKKSTNHKQKHVVIPTISTVVTLVIIITVILGVVYYKIRKKRISQQPLRMRIYLNQNYVSDSEV